MDYPVANKVIERFIKELNKMTNTENTSTDSTATATSTTELRWKTPEEYKAETGHRFRMNKEEQAAGVTRQEAFEARQRAGKLQ